MSKTGDPSTRCPVCSREARSGRYCAHCGAELDHEARISIEPLQAAGGTQVAPEPESAGGGAASAECVVSGQDRTEDRSGGDVDAPQGGVRRIRWVALVAIVLFIAGLTLALMLRADQSEDLAAGRDGAVAPPSLDSDADRTAETETGPVRPDSSSTTSSTTIEVTTTTTTMVSSTPATLSIEDVLNEARAGWPPPEIVHEDILSSQVALVDGRPVVVTLPRLKYESEPATVWEFDDGWRRLRDHLDEYGYGFSSAEQVEFADLTGDGRPELFIRHALNRFVGTVYRASGDDWVVITGGEGLRLDGGRLVGVERSCDPDCASGGSIEYELVWDGREFAYQVLSRTPPPSTQPVCPAYRDEQIPPRLCDRGVLVENLQRALIYSGFMSGGADGYYGPATAEAVRRLQRAMDLPPTGVLEGRSYYEFMENYRLLVEWD